MKITVFISINGHILIASISDYFLPLFVLYSLCLQQTPQLVMALHLVE